MQVLRRFYHKQPLHLGRDRVQLAGARREPRRASARLYRSHRLAWRPSRVGHVRGGGRLPWPGRPPVMLLWGGFWGRRYGRPGLGGGPPLKIADERQLVLAPGVVA